MTSIIDNPYIKQKCQIFTPNNIVEQMLDIAGYTSNVYGKKVLENSCGNGEFLLGIVNRYVKSCKQQRFSKKKIKLGLEKDIVAFEIDEQRKNECICRLNSLVAKYKINNVIWNIKSLDFLSMTLTEKFDYVIGNPPYIAYPDLPIDTRKFVKENFKTCVKGKFDYSYAFIEKSYYSLSEKGKLVYIIPSNIFKNVFAQDVRNLIKDDLDVIVDFPNDSVFDKVLVSPAIIKVVKNINSFLLKYQSGNLTRTLFKENLKTKWIFEDEKASIGIRVGDHFKVSSSIATLLNKAFVINNGIVEGDYLLIDNDKIEYELLRPAASPKNKKYNTYSEYIIFPYYFDKNDVLHCYTQEEMYRKFPFAMKYLEKFKAKLEKRNSDKNAQWFEYGRSQAIRNVNKQMILISSVISSCTKAYLLSDEEIPYSGLYIIPIDDSNLVDLLEKLNSKDFKNYIQRIGVCVSGTSKRVTPKDIEDYNY